MGQQLTTALGCFGAGQRSALPPTLSLASHHTHIDTASSDLFVVHMLRLLAYIQLPSLMDLTVETSDCPPGSVRSFLEAVQTACITHSIMSLKFSQYSGTLGDILSFDDLETSV